MVQRECVRPAPVYIAADLIGQDQKGQRAARIGQPQAQIAVSRTRPKAACRRPAPVIGGGIAAIPAVRAHILQPELQQSFG